MSSFLGWSWALGSDYSIQVFTLLPSLTKAGNTVRVETGISAELTSGFVAMRTEL